MAIYVMAFILPWLLLAQADKNDTTSMARKSHEERLFAHLLQGYNNLSRPVQNYSDSIQVNLVFMLMRLIEMDEKNEVIQLYGWLDYTWKDYKLQWNPDEYGNITRMSLPIEKLWRPDVFLYNAVESNFETGYPTNAILQNTGNVRWVTPSIFKSSCPLNITWFPFDEQKCFLEFSTWTYPAQEVDLMTDLEYGFDTSQYVTNGEWLLSKYYVLREQVTYSCCPNKPYTILRFHMDLRRRTLYYLFNMIFPSLIITLISLLSFVLPPESGDKTAIQIAVLLSICFFFSILSGMLPATSEAVPLLGLFFVSCMLIVTASLCSTVYVLNLHYRTRKMGPMANALLLHWLPWALRMAQNNQEKLKWSSLPPLFPFSHRPPRNSIAVEHEAIDKVSIEEENANANDGQFPTIPPQLPPYNSDSILFEQIQSQIQTISNQIRDKFTASANENAVQNEWKFAAAVLDRIFLIIFSMLIAGTIIFLVIQAPYLLDGHIR